MSVRLLPNTDGLQQVDDYEQDEQTFREITKVVILIFGIPDLIQFIIGSVPVK
jgi:hypothetical protein